MTKIELTDNYVRSLPLSDVGLYQVRDVRVEFQVGPEIDMQPIVVICNEPI